MKVARLALVRYSRQSGEGNLAKETNNPHPTMDGDCLFVYSIGRWLVLGGVFCLYSLG